MNPKPKRQKQRVRRGRSATATASKRAETATDPDDADSTLNRVLDHAAHPGRLVTWAVVLVIIVVGWRWPQYVVDPTLVSGRMRYVVALVIAAVLFGSFSTLTLLAYCLVFGGLTEVNKKFDAAVLNRAGIGATLGTLLGVRLAPALLSSAPGARVAFPDYLSDVGNVVTLLTLVLISTAWPHSLGPLIHTVVDWFDRFSIRLPVPVGKWLTVPVVLGVHALGSSLALAVYFALTRP